MPEPLSDPRRSLLLSLKLCSTADLRRAGRHVRRLARDLPAFDSAWLDALVRIGRLTPFQAKLLESSEPERIRLGPCVLVDRLGGGPLGETFLGVGDRSGSRCAVKVVSASDRLSPEAEERLSRLVDALRDLEHPSVVAPLAAERVGEQWVVMSRYVPGAHLAELLVRRGRFPPLVVLEIGKQLADGLAALERRGIVHGDIRATNVRLANDGIAVLVDTGIRAAIDQELSVHSGLPANRYDGAAPELIGSMNGPTVASDLYSLGCVLWQLLAGRPPFPGADPLVKLAAHRTRTVDDVRHWAPETPELLARGIRLMTAREPADRPASFSEVAQLWGTPRRSGRRRLAAFRRWFDRPVPRLVEGNERPAGFRWRTLCAMLLVVSVTAIALRHEGARGVLLSWSARIPHAGPESDIAGGPLPEADEAPTNGETADAPASDPAGKWLEIPAPDPQGVIRLETAGPYRVRDIAAVGGLTLLAASGVTPEILIHDRPLKISAETVRLVGLRFRRSTLETVRPPAALVMTEAQTLEVERCVVQVSEIGGESSGIGLAWRLIDPRDPQGGRAAIRDTIFLGGDTALFFADAARRVEIFDCLRLSGGPLAHLAAGLNRSDVGVKLEATTCRQATALFRIAAAAEGAIRSGVAIEASDCVFDLTAPGGRLFEFVGDTPAAALASRTKLTGEGSLAPPGLATAMRLRPSERTPEPFDAPVAVEGILSAPYRFAGPLSSQPTDAELLEYEAPRRSTKPPGIRASDLPATP